MISNDIIGIKKVRLTLPIRMPEPGFYSRALLVKMGWELGIRYESAKKAAAP
jgi:hypothetical protein